MKRVKIAMIVLLFLTAGWGALSLAKPPGGGGTQSCNKVVCAQCPEGYVLAKPAVWPNCCVCVLAP